MPYLTPHDLSAFIKVDEAKAAAMIKDAEALAVLAAPCISSAEFAARPDLADALRAVLRRAIIRWHEGGVGAVQQSGAGSFQQTTMPTSPKGLFWPSEVVELRRLCTALTGERGGAWSVDLAPAWNPHAAWCRLRGDGPYCTCGMALVVPS